MRRGNFHFLARKHTSVEKLATVKRSSLFKSQRQRRRKKCLMTSTPGRR